MVVNFSGAVKLPSKDSHGVLAQIISSRAGVLGEWKIAPASESAATVAQVHVAAGETIDFLLDCAGDTTSDSFHWAPRITASQTAAVVADARDNFTGPATDPWQELAQALLCTNEFVFVD
jgi:hypothetical protein